MGRRYLDIHSDLITSLFRDGPHPAYRVVRDPLPEDAWVVGVEMLDIGIERYPGVVRLTLESAEWPAGELTSICPYMRLET